MTQPPASADTSGYRVEVESFFEAHASAPAAGRWVFRYQITIRNISGREAQLLRRHWVITDAEGKVVEVEGEGVVGHQPTLSRGQAFAYESFCPLETPFGWMRGTYVMRDERGDLFSIDIPLFGLQQPNAVH